MHKKLIAVTVLFVLLASTLVGCSGTSPTDSTLTILSITEGDVFVMKAGTDDWTKATLEMSLQVGDTIKTGDDSGAEITFFDGSTIELEAGTLIEITALNTSPDTGTKTITLMQTIGTTISRVTKLLDPASTYAIETPSGVAAVRGTTLIVRIVFDDPNYEDYTVLITCVEGDIWLTWNGVELHITEGYTCIIRPDGVLEIIPSSELPQEESGGTDEETTNGQDITDEDTSDGQDVTDEDTTNGQDEDLGPAGSVPDPLREPPVYPPFKPDPLDIDFSDFYCPPIGGGDETGGGGDQNGGGGDETGGGGDQNGGEATGTIHVVTPGTTDALIYIEVETAEGERVWATDLESGQPVDGQHGVSDLVTVAGDHHYYVWVGGDGNTYNVHNTNPLDWGVRDAPAGYSGEQADGDLPSGDQQNVQFKEA